MPPMPVCHHPGLYHHPRAVPSPPGCPIRYEWKRTSCESGETPDHVDLGQDCASVAEGVDANPFERWKPWRPADIRYHPPTDPLWVVRRVERDPRKADCRLDSKAAAGIRIDPVPDPLHVHVTEDNVPGSASTVLGVDSLAARPQDGTYHAATLATPTKSTTPTAAEADGIHGSQAFHHQAVSDDLDRDDDRSDGDAGAIVAGSWGLARDGAWAWTRWGSLALALSLVGALLAREAAAWQWSRAAQRHTIDAVVCEGSRSNEESLYVAIR